MSTYDTSTDRRFQVWKTECFYFFLELIRYEVIMETSWLENRIEKWQVWINFKLKKINSSWNGKSIDENFDNFNHQTSKY